MGVIFELNKQFKFISGLQKSADRISNAMHTTPPCHPFKFMKLTQRFINQNTFEVIINFFL